MRPRSLGLHAVAALGLLALTGCSVSPLARRAAAFAPAATAAAKDTTAAYALVEQTHNQTEIATLVSNFDTDGFDLDKIKPFMPPKDMEARTKVLAGLAQYAEMLAYVSGDEPLTEFDTQAAALGKSLQTLSQSSELSSLTKSAHVSGTDVNIAATAIDALGRALITRRRSRELPGILKEMQGPIVEICALLEADLGAPETSGLRNQLHNDYGTLRRKQLRFIRDNKTTLSATDKRAALEELPKLAAAEAAGDRALAATQAALQQLAATHTALAASAGEKESPAFRTMLSELIHDGQQLGGFYAQLSAK